MIYVKSVLALLLLSAAFVAHCASPNRPDCVNAVVKFSYVQYAPALFAEDGLMSGQDALTDRWLEVVPVLGDKSNWLASKLIRCNRCKPQKPGRAVLVCQKPRINLISSSTGRFEDVPFELIAVDAMNSHSSSLYDSNVPAK